MLGPDKEEKLKGLFQAAPESVLSGLHVVLVRNLETDIDERLLTLIEQAAVRRGIALTDPDRDGTDLDDTGPDTASQSRFDEPEDISGEASSDHDLLILETPDASGDDEPDADGAPAPAPDPFTPPRNAMHAFFLPFESLIIDPPRYAPRIDGYLCSTSLPGIWRMLNDEGSGAVIRDCWLRAELERDDQSEDYFRHITSEMHAAARVIVESIAERSRSDRAVRRAVLSRLGGEAGYGDFTELAAMLPLILSFRDAFARLRTVMTRPLKACAGEMAGMILEHHRARPRLAAYLQYAVLSNLDEPWQAMWLHEALGAQARSGVQAREAGTGEAAEARDGKPVSVIGGHLIYVLELQGKWLERRLETDEDSATEALDPFIGFAAQLSGMMTRRGQLDDTGLEGRLDALVEDGAGLFDQLIETAGGVLEQILRSRADDEGGQVPDLDWTLSEPEAARLSRAARDAARFVQAGDMVAPMFARSQVWKSFSGETMDMVHDYIASVTRGLRNGSIDRDEETGNKAALLLPLAHGLCSQEAAAALHEAFAGMRDGHLAEKIV